MSDLHIEIVEKLKDYILKCEEKMDTKMYENIDISPAILLKIKGAKEYARMLLDITEEEMEEILL